MLPFFFLPVDKPAGMTSHDVVARVRGAVRRRFPKGTKVGHSGTLDPFATGLLILGVGKATRFSDEVHLLPKTYEAELVLGSETDTLDCDGRVCVNKPVPFFDDIKLEDISKTFLGLIKQVPPSYSSKKVDGVRSYVLAREQRSVELQACDVVIHELKLSKLADDRIFLRVSCSTGTYVRSLGRDIASALGSVGHLDALRRTQIGSVNQELAYKMTIQEPVDPDILETFSMSVSNLLPSIPEMELPATTLDPLLNGRQVPVGEPYPHQFLGKIQGVGRVAAIFRCQYDPDSQCVVPKMLCYRCPDIQK